MERRRRVARGRGPLVVLVAGALAAAGILAFRTGRDGDDPPRTADLQRCRGLADEGARECYARELLALVDRDDPHAAVAGIAATARREDGFLLANCHGVMHTVGRTYARERGLTLASLRDVLPRSNDPGCSAGFAHGLVTGVAPRLDPRRPRAASAVCADTPTRYQRYSCVHGLGHAFMRMHDGSLTAALDLCRALGPPAPDCAQGAYHDYWFAVAGVDDAELMEAALRDPRALCARQPPRFVRPCWYRAYVQNRPAAFDVRAAEDVDALCDGLAGLQRRACVTAAAVIGPSDPFEQLGLCSGLAAAADQVACARGTKVQNLLDPPLDTYVRLIRRCDGLVAAARRGCYRWLGKALAVVTDGAFGASGCVQLDAQVAVHCRAGARAADGPLETFS